MIGRRSKETVLEEPEVEVVTEARAGAKGKATPKRAEARAARSQMQKTVSNGHVLQKRAAALPTDPKARKAAVRQIRRDQFDLERQAMKNGDEANLPAQHAGPTRKRARQLVDANRPVASYLLFTAYALVLISVATPNRTIGNYVTLLEAVFLLSGAVTLLLQARVVVKVLDKEGEPTKGMMLYCALRMAVPKRLRKPRPVVQVATTRKGGVRS